MRLVGEGVIVGQLEHLAVGRFGQTAFRKPQTDAPQPRQCFEISFAILIANEDAVTLGDHDRALGLVQLEIRIGVNRMNVAAGRSRHMRSMIACRDGARLDFTCSILLGIMSSLVRERGSERFCIAKDRRWGLGGDRQ